MNAPARFGRDGGDDDEVYTLETPVTDAQGRSRQDGWTPKRQHSFLTALAEGHTVEQCCRFVGLTVSSAYALRRRAAGAAFALGWQAAALLARDTFADTLAARAIDGQVETITRPDGSEVTRHRYDNRLAMAMLTRLDKLAAADGSERTHHAARLIASDWEAYLAGIERGGGPARAGLFLGARVGAAADVEGQGPDIGPLVALARADRFVRTGAAMLDELDVRDLDPACRDAWSAADWTRAEAAGLVVLAAPPAPPPVEPVSVAAECDAHGTPPLPPLPPRHDDMSGPVWWDEERCEWLTWFPVAEGGALPDYESGGSEDGFDDYERSLTPDELVALEAARAELLDDPLPDPHAEREAWFAGLRAAVAAAEREAGTSAEEDGAEERGATAFPRESGGPGAASDDLRDPGLLRSQENGAAEEDGTTSFPRERGGPGATGDDPCDSALLRSHQNGRAEERADHPDVAAG